MSVSPSELLPVAEEAARVAGALLRERFLAGPETEIHAKSSPTDLASEADLAAEAAIREVLADQRPDDAILAEEGGGDQELEPGRVRWVVDPLDGTTNYLYGIPQWCVSVACEDAARGLLAGAVFDPIRRELFTATAGGRALLNGRPIAARAEAPVAESLLVTGFGYDSDLRARQAEVVAGLLPRVRDIRRFGAAALDLAWLAAGRHDAYFERGVNWWDIAAGSLLLQRVGLEVRALPDAEGVPGGIAAGRASLLDELWPFGP